jgi:hypothetical protein
VSMDIFASPMPTASSGRPAGSERFREDYAG